jgi:hypothetical protein
MRYKTGQAAVLLWMRRDRERFLFLLEEESQLPSRYTVH